jgi:hypothetical protein
MGTGSVGEDEVVGHLLGPSGGTFALGMIVGGFLTWVGNLKIVNPYMQRAHAAEIQALQSKIEAMDLAFRAELTSMKARIQELEATEKEYHAILKERAKLRDD